MTADNNIYLRKNITTGAYKNVHHYLDVNFRLLREDFLQPLREGINEFKAIIEEEKRTQTSNLKTIESRNLMKRISNIDGLRAYYDVYFSSCSCSDKGIKELRFSNFDYAKECNIYDKRRWPSHFQMKLDESQYKAIRMVLNQNLYQC